MSRFDPSRPVTLNVQVCDGSRTYPTGKYKLSELPRIAIETGFVTQEPRSSEPSEAVKKPLPTLEVKTSARTSVAEEISGALSSTKPVGKKKNQE